MIEFLENCKLRKETIEQLSKKYPSELFDLNANEEECVEIIEYLRDIGINCIDELLLYRTDLFYNSRHEVERMIEKNNISEIVSEINNDFTKIDELF